VIVEDVKHCSATLQAIRAMGVTIAIEDCGSGFSALRHLAKLPVHTLKIDRSLIADMPAAPQGWRSLRLSSTLAHSLNLKSVGESVATEEGPLRVLTCNAMQGYLVSKPAPGPPRQGVPAQAPSQPAALSAAIGSSSSSRRAS